MSMSTESEESVSPMLKQTEASNEMNPYERLLIDRIIQARKAAIEKIKQSFKGMNIKFSHILF